MKGRTSGWVSLGLSRDSQMPGSDVILGWVNDISGAVVVADQYADSYDMPVTDPEASKIFGISGSQADGWTTVSFSRPADTGDAKDIPFFWTEGATKKSAQVLYAMAPVDARALSGGRILYNQHNSQGSGAVDFLSSTATVTAADDKGDLEPGRVLCFVMLGLLGFALLRKLCSSDKAEDQPSSLWLRFCRACPRLTGLLQTRLQLFDAQVVELLVFLSYIGINMALLFLIKNKFDYAKNIGYLAIANSVILVLPALRNSILQYAVRFYLLFFLFFLSSSSLPLSVSLPLTFVFCHPSSAGTRDCAPHHVPPLGCALCDCAHGRARCHAMEKVCRRWRLDRADL